MNDARVTMVIWCCSYNLIVSQYILGTTVGASSTLVAEGTVQLHHFSQSVAADFRRYDPKASHKESFQ